MKKRERMQKKTVLMAFAAFFGVIVLVLVSSTSTAQSQFSAQRGFEWLAAHCQNGNCRSDIMTTAFYTLAMKNAGQTDYANQGLDYIKSRKDSREGCWPTGGCAVKDTAFALWTLNAFGIDTSDGEAYLRNALSVADDLRDYWYLQVITTNNNTCTIAYNLGNSTQTAPVRVDAGTFPDCSGSVPTFFDLNACIQPNLLSSHPSLELDIDCNTLGPSTILSIIFVDGNSYYVIDEQQAPRQKTTIQNGCFGAKKQTPCDLETSMYTNWLLSAIGSDTTVLLYNKNNADPFSTTHNSLLSLSSEGDARTSYIENLVKQQDADGSFDGDVYKTAFAVLALVQSSKTQELTSAVNWLKTKQKEDGSWDTSELNTAVTLYSAFTGEPVSLPPLIPPATLPETFESCGDGICSGTESALSCAADCPTTTPGCNFNLICESYYGETSTNCSSDCPEIQETCNYDQVCQPEAGETSANCPLDCAQQSGEETPAPEEDEGGFPWLTIFIILIVGLLAFLFMRFRRAASGKKKPASPATAGQARWFPPSQPPATPAQPMTARQSSRQQSSSIDDELEKSLKEAKKLLKKI